MLKNDGGSRASCIVGLGRISENVVGHSAFGQASKGQVYKFGEVAEGHPVILGRVVVGFSDNFGKSGQGRFGSGHKLKAPL